MPCLEGLTICVSKCLVIHNTSIMVCDIRVSHYVNDTLQILTIPANNSEIQDDMGHSNQGHWEENTAIQQLVMLNAIVACTTTDELEICKPVRSINTQKLYSLGTTTNRRTEILVNTYKFTNYIYQHLLTVYRLYLTVCTCIFTNCAYQCILTILLTYLPIHIVPILLIVFGYKY